MSKPALLIALAALALTGCGELFGQSVKQPSTTVTSVLYNMPPSADLMKIPTLFPNTGMTSVVQGSSVVWTYTLYGQPACRFTAHVKPSGAEISTVWTDMDEIWTEKDARYLCVTVQIAGEESVAATLDGREADRKKVQGEMAAATVGNAGSLMKGAFDAVEHEMGNFNDHCRDAPTTAQMQACRD